MSIESLDAAQEFFVSTRVDEDGGAGGDGLGEEGEGAACEFFGFEGFELFDCHVANKRVRDGITCGSFQWSLTCKS